MQSACPPENRDGRFLCMSANSRASHNYIKIEFNYHSLRHTHAIMLIQAGAPIKDVQERLRHSDHNEQIRS